MAESEGTSIVEAKIPDTEWQEFKCMVISGTNTITTADVLDTNTIKVTDQSERDIWLIRRNKITGKLSLTRHKDLGKRWLTQKTGNKHDLIYVDLEHYNENITGWQLAELVQAKIIEGRAKPRK